MSLANARSVKSRTISARSRDFRVAAALCGAALLLSNACEGPSVPDTNAGTLCTTDSECDPGDTCVNNHCAGTSGGPVDAGHPDAGHPPDAGPVLEGHLTLSPLSSDLGAVVGAAPSPVKLTVGNDGPASFSYTAACTGGATVPSGAVSVAAGAVSTLTVTLPSWSTASVQAVSCTVATSNGTGGPLTWTANVTVSTAPAARLSVTPLSSGNLAVVVGTAPAPVALTIGNTGEAALHYSITCTGGATPPGGGAALAAGATGTASIALPTATSVGSHAVSCDVASAEAANAPLHWTATLVAASQAAGHLTLSPATSAVTVQAGLIPSPVALTLGNDGSALLHYAVACSAGTSASPASGSLAAGAAGSVQVNLPSYPAQGTQTATCSATTSDGSNTAALTWNATVTVTPAPATGPVGPGGGTVDLINFVFTGDTRPTTCDSTGTYPAAAFAVILGSIPKYAPQFGLDLGDHMFVCGGAPGETKLQTAQKQMKLYTDALASKWPSDKLWFMTMGNHECNSGGGAQVCGTSDPNYVAFYAALTTVSQQTNPNYKLDFNTSQGLVRIVVLADNQATPADVAQADAWLTEADASAKAVFVAKHHTVEPGSRTGPTWVLSLIDKHRVTAILVAHDHSYRRSAYPRGGGLGGSVPNVVCGLGAANSGNRGFCRMQQKSDGSFDMTQYDDMGNPGDPLGVWNLKGLQ